MDDLPDIALSVRQPWAWAIIDGCKVIENRSEGAIRAGGMTCRRIAVHAARGMTRREYDWAVWRLERHGVACPRPDALPRGAIIGAVDVVEIVSDSDSEWFGGPMGLMLARPMACEPIPAAGALGYFRWAPSEALAPVPRWMRDWGGAAAGPGLFDALPAAWARAPQKPFGGTKKT